MHPQPLVPEPPEDPAGPSGVAPRPEQAEEPGERPDPATWPALPEPVRDRIAELSAAAVAKLPATDEPHQQQPNTKFAPAKRAKLGGAALLAALGESSQFRTAVIEWLREHRTDALDPNATDSVAAAAAAVLLGESGAAGRVRLVAKNAEENALRAERDAALARSQRLEGELMQLRVELAEAKKAAESARGEREGEVEKL